MAAIKLGVAPRDSILALGDRDEEESDIPLLDSTLRSQADKAGRGESFESVAWKSRLSSNSEPNGTTISKVESESRVPGPARKLLSCRTS